MCTDHVCTCLAKIGINIERGTSVGASQKCGWGIARKAKGKCGVQPEVWLMIRIETTKGECGSQPEVWLEIRKIRADHMMSHQCQKFALFSPFPFFFLTFIGQDKTQDITPCASHMMALQANAD